MRPRFGGGGGGAAAPGGGAAAPGGGGGAASSGGGGASGASSRAAWGRKSSETSRLSSASPKARDLCGTQPLGAAVGGGCHVDIPRAGRDIPEFRQNLDGIPTPRAKKLHLEGTVAILVPALDRDTASSPMTRRWITKPPAARIRAASSSRPGVWSVLSGTHAPPRHLRATERHLERDDDPL